MFENGNGNLRPAFGAVKARIKLSQLYSIPVYWHNSNGETTIL